jgi:RNA polymerase sigma factor (sigma-70 family)
MTQPAAEDGRTAADFPVTPLSSLARLKGNADGRRREHLEKLCRLYWKPVYAFVRRAFGSPRDKAEDLAQEFFAWALDTELLAKFDPACGNFRSFLKAVLRNFVREDHRRTSAAKRGGALRFVPIGVETEPDLLQPSLPPEEAFDRQWMQEVLAQAVQRLERELAGQGRGAWFEALRLYDLEDQPLTYRAIAERLGVNEGEVRNYLHRARVRLRELLIACLSEYIGTEEDVMSEMRDLLKI